MKKIRELVTKYFINRLPIPDLTFVVLAQHQLLMPQPLLFFGFLLMLHLIVIPPDYFHIANFL